MPAFNLVEPLSQSLPLWAIGLLLILIAALALEGGAWVARRQLARSERQENGRKDSSDAQGYIIGAIFGLLAFLIGLTFSIALDRYEKRRGWVAEEATAISTAYLRADLFDEPHRSDLRSTLRQYARARIVEDGITTAELQNREAQIEHLSADLWRETRDAIFPVRETELASYFVDAMNTALDVGTRRALEGKTHIPPQIIDVQLVYLVVAAAVLGYLLGMERSRRRYASSLLIALFTLAFLLILDIDRPRSGTIRISQLALQQLVDQMEADARREAAGRQLPPT